MIIEIVKKLTGNNYAMMLLVAFLFSISSDASSQQQLRIMTYNLLNYPGSDTAVRNPYFRTIVNAVNPDILVVCEITSQSGVNSFLANVMNSNGNVYSAGTFLDGTDTDNAIFFKTSKINFISNTPIITQLRTINEFKITDKIYHDTLRIYEVHLKANLGDSLTRGAEVDSLRKKTNLLPPGTNFIVAGDFNIYSSNETAYKKLIKDNPGDDGNFLDPMIMTGVWNNSSYASYHTQSTRTRSFGNGSTGGMDDRFDMILYSNAVKNPGGIKFVPGTYTPYGNDGQHYNDSINMPPNNAVGQTIANALHYASDHLPVYASFEFGNATAYNVKLAIEGFYDSSMNRLSRRDTVHFYLHRTVPPYSIEDSSTALLDTLTLTANAIFRSAPSGSYFIQVRHLNTLETWSKSGGNAYDEDSINVYDFTSASSQAFGNNMVLKGTRYCLFSGDIDQDGTIDLSDIAIAFNEASNFSTGYLPADVNGDNIADLTDIIITFNNASSFVSKITP